MLESLKVKLRQKKRELTASDLMEIYAIEGKRAYLYMLKYKREIQKQSDTYFLWRKEEEKNLYQTGRLKKKPFFSVIIDKKESDIEYMDACMRSVKRQTYKKYEILINTSGYMDSSFLEKAAGDYIVCVNGRDLLAPNALYELAKAVSREEEADWIYSDEDKITKDGLVRYEPFFKPDWSPDTLLSFFYTGNLAAYRSDLAKAILLETEEKHYEFALRFMEYAKKVIHIDKILYHSRKNSIQKLGDIEVLENEPEEEVSERIEQLRLEIRKSHGCQPEREPLVSIIILSKDHVEMLQECIEKIRWNTDYENYEIVVVDNGSSAENQKACELLSKEFQFHYYYEPLAFNFSKMCNIGSRLAKGDYLLFLNDDIFVQQRDWLEKMLAQAMLDYAGAVGAKLLYPGTALIQHAGVTNYEEIGPAHSLLEYEDSTSYYFGRNKFTYNYVAVTGACLLLEKKKFEEAGGFDEQFAVSYNDIALCFALCRRGYYNAVCNEVILYHKESASRGIDKEDIQKSERLLEERNKLYQKFPEFYGKDPFYSRHLSPKYCDFSLRPRIDQKISKKYSRIKEENELILLESEENNRLRLHVDEISMEDEKDIIITGWAFVMFKKNNCNLQRRLLLVGADDKKMLVHTRPRYRRDVAEAFPEEERILMTGYECRIPKKKLNLEKNSYQVGMYVKDPVSEEVFFCMSDQSIG